MFAYKCVRVLIRTNRFFFLIFFLCRNRNIRVDCRLDSACGWSSHVFCVVVFLPHLLGRWLMCARFRHYLRFTILDNVDMLSNGMRIFKIMANWAEIRQEIRRSSEIRSVLCSLFIHKNLSRHCFSFFFSNYISGNIFALHWKIRTANAYSL